MSEPTTQHDNGEGGNRATVALVAEKVESLRELTRAGFSDLQRQLDAVAGLPIAMEGLRRDHEALVQRVELHEDQAAALSHMPTTVAELKDDVEELKRERDNDSAWRRNNLPMLVLLSLGTIVNVLLTVLTHH